MNTAILALSGKKYSTFIAAAKGYSQNKIEPSQVVITLEAFMSDFAAIQLEVNRLNLENQLFQILNNPVPPQPTKPEPKPEPKEYPTAPYEVINSDYIQEPVILNLAEPEPEPSAHLVEEVVSKAVEKALEPEVLDLDRDDVEAEEDCIKSTFARKVELVEPDQEEKIQLELPPAATKTKKREPIELSQNQLELIAKLSFYYIQILDLEEEEIDNDTWDEITCAYDFINLPWLNTL